MPKIEQPEHGTLSSNIPIKLPKGSKTVTVEVRDNGDLADAISDAMEMALKYFYEIYKNYPLHENIQFVGGCVTGKLVFTLVEDLG